MDSIPGTYFIPIDLLLLGYIQSKFSAKFILNNIIQFEEIA